MAAALYDCPKGLCCMVNTWILYLYITVTHSGIYICDCVQSTSVLWRKYNNGFDVWKQMENHFQCLYHPLNPPLLLKRASKLLFYFGGAFTGDFKLVFISFRVNFVAFGRRNAVKIDWKDFSGDSNMGFSHSSQTHSLFLAKPPPLEFNCH